MSGPQVHVQWPDGAAPFPLARAAIGDGTLADRLARAGRPLNTRCGQHGRCAGCTVQLVEGTFQRRDGTGVTGPAEIKACQGEIAPETAALIAVPARAVAAHRPQVVTTFRLGVSAAQVPLVPPVPGGADHGLAIDVGTTTVVVALVDLTTGTIIREEAAFNRQIEIGEDVLTRIQVAGDAAKREQLRERVVAGTLAPLIAAAIAAAGVGAGRLAAAVVAGNTTMLHLLTGTDPTSMGVAPFQPAFLGHRVIPAGELGIDHMPATMPVHLLPGFSAFVGADLVAGCVCAGLQRDAGPALLVDVGTNGEILLWHEGRLQATATAAGPAFEGGQLERGTRAAAGAIAHVRFPNGSLPAEVDCIPGAPRHGLCGSAYVDFLAEARRCGWLTPSGRIDAAAWSTLPAAYRFEQDDRRGLRLLPDDPAAIVTEFDVAHLLQAKAAIAAGILTLLRRAGLAPEQVERVYLAGGFGLHLEVPNAIACGLLPGFRPEQIEVVGNTSLGGAWLALVDRTVLPEMTALRAGAEVVELNLDPGFEDTFIDQLLLP